MGLIVNSIEFDELTSDPGSPIEGQHWYNTTEKCFKCFTNGSIRVMPLVPAGTGATDFIDQSWSAGSVSGFALTENGDGTVDIASGYTYLRESASETAPIHYVAVSGVTGLSLTNNSINYIYVDYNGGTPDIVATTNISDFNCMDKCLIYVSARHGTDIHYLYAGGQSVDANRKLRRRYLENITRRFERIYGAVIGASGLHINLTEGRFYFGLTLITTLAFDSSGTDSFTYVYRDGSGGWMRSTGQTQIDNIRYDDGSGTPATMTANRFRVDHVYWVIDSPNELYVVMGTAQHHKLSEAVLAPTPSGLPPETTALGVLVGRVIIEKSAIVLSDVSSPFTTTFTQGAPTSHNDLANLNSGDYQHLTAAQAAQLQNMNTGKILGRSSVGTGPLEELNVGSGLSLSGGTLSATGSSGSDSGFANLFLLMGA